MACLNAAFSPRLRWIIFGGMGFALPACLLALAFSGCRARSPAQALIGGWHGRVSTGNLSVPVQWKLRGDGSQSVTLTLPQGLLTAHGTYAYRADDLTLCTTGRAITLAGEEKTMPLVSPMETTYQCRVSGDTLTLARPDTHEMIVLTRDKP